MKKMKRWKLIFRLIFNPKNHNFWFEGLIRYALNNYEKNRGDGASDVLFYEEKFNRDILK